MKFEERFGLLKILLKEIGYHFNTASTCGWTTNPPMKLWSRSGAKESHSSLKDVFEVFKPKINITSQNKE